MHLSTESTTVNNDILQTTMLYKVEVGPVEEENYGINLARAIGFPPRFLEVAQQVSDELRQSKDAKKRDEKARKVVARRNLLLNLQELLCAAHESEMDEFALSEYLLGLQKEFVDRLSELQGGEADYDEDDNEDGGDTIITGTETEHEDQAILLSVPNSISYESSY
jgi:DNA mismatch repair protein MSH4